MIIKKLKQNKVITIAVMAALCITLIMGTMAVFAQSRAEGKVSQLSKEGAKGDVEIVNWENRLLKDIYSKEVVLGVCEKFNLDYDTAIWADITPDMCDFVFALNWKLEDGEWPLLTSEAEELMSLEMEVNDLHAFYGTRPIIEEVCGEAGIDPAKSKVKDLTVEQLQSITERAYEASDHKDL